MLIVADLTVAHEGPLGISSGYGQVEPATGITNMILIAGKRRLLSQSLNKYYHYI